MCVCERVRAHDCVRVCVYVCNFICVSVCDVSMYVCDCVGMCVRE